jgi:hypothetical protein
MDGKEKSAHEWMIEFKDNPTDAQFQILDESIQSLNSITSQTLQQHDFKPL